MLRMTPKSCKYNKYPGPRPRKRPFLWTAGSFFRPHPRKRPFLWTAGSFFRPHPRKRAFSWIEKDSPKLSYQGGGS